MSEKHSVTLIQSDVLAHGDALAWSVSFARSETLAQSLFFKTIANRMIN